MHANTVLWQDVRSAHILLKLILAPSDDITIRDFAQSHMCDLNIGFLRTKCL